MTKTPTVAAIIPTMNRADRLRGALESVFGQTYEKLNAVVIDGSDTNETRNVVSKFEDQYGSNRVTYIYNTDPLGPSAARNMAVDATDAELLAFLDDDDRWAPNKTAKQVAQFRNSTHELGLSYTGRHSQTDDGRIINTRRPSSGDNIYQQMLVQNVIGSPSLIMITAEAFKQVGGFDEDMIYQEDWELYIRLSKQYNVKCLSEPLAYRTYHCGSRSRSTDKQKKYRKMILQKYESELCENGIYHLAHSVQDRETGLEYAHGGNISKARSEFKSSLNHNFHHKTLLLYLITFGGNIGFQSATKLKRTLA